MAFEFNRSYVKKSMSDDGLTRKQHDIHTISSISNSCFISYAEIDRHSNNTCAFKHVLLYNIIRALNLNVHNSLKPCTIVFEMLECTELVNRELSYLTGI